jgi:hypothetical protein
MDMWIAKVRDVERVSPISVHARDWLDNNWYTAHVRNNVLEVQPQRAISMIVAALSAGVALEFIENGNS